MAGPDTSAVPTLGANQLKYVQYSHALEAEYLPAIRALISKDLSEPYSVYVYRYFLYQWDHLCYMVSNCTVSSTQKSSEECFWGLQKNWSTQSR